MKRPTAGLAVLFLLAITLQQPVRAQSMSHEEEVVRNAYAKLSFMCELVPLTKAAFDTNPHTGGDGPRRYDQAALDTAIVATCPVFSLSAFSTGPISDIASEPLSQFVTLPTTHDQVLDVKLQPTSYNYFGNKTEWVATKIFWENSSATGYPFDQGLTVSAALQKKLTLWTDQPGTTFDRYAAYTIDATLQSQSTGPHRAIFFFGHDANGKQVVAPNDPISGPGILFNVLDVPSYPAAFLTTNIRDVPVVATWVRSHEMPVAACSTAANRAICCAGGRCGISQADLNRDLAMPLPKVKNIGGAQ
jgi:hypothetical protein